MVFLGNYVYEGSGDNALVLIEWEENGETRTARCKESFLCLGILDKKGRAEEEIFDVAQRRSATHLVYMDYWKSYVLFRRIDKSVKKNNEGGYSNGLSGIVNSHGSAFLIGSNGKKDCPTKIPKRGLLAICWIDGTMKDYFDDKRARELMRVAKQVRADAVAFETHKCCPGSKKREEKKAGWMFYRYREQ